MNIDNEIKRINRQIAQAAKLFGKESRLYQQYETILSGGLAQAQLTRENKSGVIQLKRTKAALYEFENITSYQKGIKNLSRMQTVKESQQAMIAAFEQRTGQTVKTKEERKAAISEELSLYNNITEKLFDKLGQIYQKQDDMGGIKYKGMRDIEKLSKGTWTSTEDLQEMIKIADKILNDENAEILENAGFDRW